MRRRATKYLRSQQPLGFTLIELMVTVAVLGILAALAAPSFADLIRNNRVASIASELGSAVNFARSEAIRRGVTVTACKSANPGASPPSCTTSGTWDQGWLIFADKGTTGLFESSTDTLLRTGQPSAQGVAISGVADSGSSSMANYFNYNPRGIPSTHGSLNVCLDQILRSVNIGATGRIHISAGSC